MSKPVLAITHLRTKNPGQFQPVLRGLGHELVFLCPGEGEALPEQLDQYAGVLSLGGPMSANDEDDALKAEMRWLEKRVLPEKIPFLGACLGAQLVARVLGATIGPHPQNHVEAGFYRVHPTDAGTEFFPHPMHVYSFHEEGFDLPSGAILMARGGESFPNQAFRYDNAFGFQFHAEVTLAMRRVWLKRTAHRLQQTGAKAKFTHYAYALWLDWQIRRWTRDFFQKWLALEK